MLNQAIHSLIDLLINIRAGAKVALFIRFRAWDFKYNFVQVLLLFAVSVLFAGAYDYLDALPKPIFNFYGLNYQTALFLAFLFSISLLTVIENKPQSLLKALVQFLSLVPTMSIVYVALVKLAENISFLSQTIILWALLILYLLWYALVSFRIITRLYHRNTQRNIYYTFLYVGINFLALFYLPNESMWYASPINPQVVKETASINVEDTYYKQPYILDRHLDRLKPETENKTDLYFLGFAGYADEAVFVHEVESAREIMDQHFDTQYRSMILANHAKRVSIYPLANTHNLWEALQGYADIMNLDEDILFMFLSSHGNEDHSLSTEFENLSMNNLTVNAVKQGLDGVGIKWRVIVVSACFSGGFIDELKDDHSLIITASRHDRSSFGCGHDGEFTYFGEAFFGTHLTQELSFIDAFEKAKVDISQREAANDYEPSLPQIYVGKDIKQKLENYLAELKVNNSMNWAQSK